MPTANSATSPPEKIHLLTRDGYRLSARHYPAHGQVLGNLIVASATGVPQGFYRRFAEHVSQRGLNVLTLDYRGIGESRPATLKGFAMSYLDWGREDLAAAVEHMSTPGLPLYWLGHSFGGQAIGLLPNHDKLSACYTFASGAGWAGWMPRGEALKVRLMWNCVLPLLVAWKGYLAWSLMGMGEDLPRGVYRDWKRWCGYPHYFFDDPNLPELAERYAQLRMPCVFATSRDDLWAPPRSRDAFVKAFRNAPMTRLDLEPAPGAPAIGHMGYFRSNAHPLWDQAVDWLLQFRD